GEGPARVVEGRARRKDDRPDPRPLSLSPKSDAERDDHGGYNNRKDHRDGQQPLLHESVTRLRFLKPMFLARYERSTISMFTPSGTWMRMSCRNARSSASRSMSRLWIRISQRSHVSLPSPSGDFRTGTSSRFVGSGIGPAIATPVRSLISLKVHATWAVWAWKTGVYPAVMTLGWFSTMICAVKDLATVGGLSVGPATSPRRRSFLSMPRMLKPTLSPGSACGICSWCISI